MIPIYCRSHSRSPTDRSGNRSPSESDECLSTPPTQHNHFSFASLFQSERGMPYFVLSMHKHMSRSFHQSRFTARTLNEYKCKQRTLTVLTINTQSAIDINISVLNHALFNFRRLGIGHPADTATSSPGYPTVNKITPGSAAAKQLFECGDVLLEFNKIPVRLFYHPFYLFHCPSIRVNRFRLPGR